MCYFPIYSIYVQYSIRQDFLLSYLFCVVFSLWQRILLQCAVFSSFFLLFKFNVIILSVKYIFAIYVYIHLYTLFVIKLNVFYCWNAEEQFIHVKEYILYKWDWSGNCKKFQILYIHRSSVLTFYRRILLKITLFIYV